MNKKGLLSIIIPCFNEEKTVSDVLNKVLAISIQGWDKEIIVIDDGSTDNTPKILRSFKEKVLVITQKNSGKGSAVKAGLARANGDYIIIQDADLEYNPEEISTLVNKINTDKDIVIYGSRNLKKESRHNSFFIPRFGVWLITALINILYGARITDSWTCYKLFPKSSKNLFDVGGFESEIIFTINLLKKGYKINEYPITHKPRNWTEGKKITYRDGLKAIWVTLSQHPLFYIIVCTTIIAILSLTLLHKPITYGDSPTYTEAMNFLQNKPVGNNFIPNRIITNFFALEIIILFSKIFGSYSVGWTVLNLFFFFIISILYYKILEKLFKSEKVAFLGTMFLVSNYVFMAFGLIYLLDIWAWASFITTFFFLLKYIDSKKYSFIILSALSVGIGGLFKEYSFGGFIAISLFLLYENWGYFSKFIKKLFLPTVISFGPFLIVSAIIFLNFDYSFLNWFKNNSDMYVYHSRTLENIKSLGSLYTLLVPMVIGGFYYFLKDSFKIKVHTNNSFTLSKEHIMYVIIFIVSALPVFIWPAITQRILFLTVPGAILIASYFMKRFDKYLNWFIIPLIFYLIIGLTMDSFILTHINIPF